MTAEAYLSGIRSLDIRIDNKIAQLDSLRAQAEKCTYVMTGMPKSTGSSLSALDSTIANIIDLQNEINTDIDCLVNLKRRVLRALKEIPNPDYQILLEGYYCRQRTWEQLADELHFSIETIYKMRRKALASFVVPED